MPRALSRSQTVWNAYSPHACGAGLPRSCGTWRGVYVLLFSLFLVLSSGRPITVKTDAKVTLFALRQVSCWSLWFQARKYKFTCCVYSTVYAPSVPNMYVLSSYSESIPPSSHARAEKREPDAHACMPGIWTNFCKICSVTLTSVIG